METFYSIKKIVLIVLGVLSLVGFGFDMYNRFTPKQQTSSQLKDSITQQIQEHLTEAPEKKEDNKVVEIPEEIKEEPEYEHETFWRFYFKFMLESDFRKARTMTEYSEVEEDYIFHANKYGDFVNQDSMETRWIYQIRYKERLVTMNFVNRQGKWFLQSAL